MFLAPSILPQDTPKVCKSKSRTFTPPPPPPQQNLRGATQSDIHRFPSSAWPPPNPPPFPFGNTSKRYTAFRHQNLELSPPPQAKPSGEQLKAIFIAFRHQLGPPPPPPPSLSVILPSATALSVIQQLPVLQEEDCLRMLRVMILAFRFQVFLFLRLRRARDLIQV